MRRIGLLVMLLLVRAPFAAVADEVTVADLVTDSAGYDGALVGEISVEGELVGDFQRRGDWVWVQLNGDSYAADPLLEGGPPAGSNIGIGARIPTLIFEALEVTTPGGYRMRGPIVLLTGEWRHHDNARGGESYLDVASAQLVSPEVQLSEGVRWWALLVGVGLLAVSWAGIAWQRLNNE